MTRIRSNFYLVDFLLLLVGAKISVTSPLLRTCNIAMRIVAFIQICYLTLSYPVFVWKGLKESDGKTSLLVDNLAYCFMYTSVFCAFIYVTRNPSAIAQLNDEILLAIRRRNMIKMNRVTILLVTSFFSSVLIHVLIQAFYWYQMSTDNIILYDAGIIVQHWSSLRVRIMFAGFMFDVLRDKLRSFSRFDVRFVRILYRGTQLP